MSSPPGGIGHLQQRVTQCDRLGRFTLMGRRASSRSRRNRTASPEWGSAARGEKPESSVSTDTWLRRIRDDKISFSVLSFSAMEEGAQGISAVSDRAISSLAIVKVNFDRGRSFLENFAPFL